METPVTLAGIEFFDEETEVFDIEVEHDHSFRVGGVIAHNSTLDLRTSVKCRALDGKMWRLPDYEPVGHDKAFPGNSAHFNCRSTQIPVLRSWDELSGKKLPSIGDEELEARMKSLLESSGAPQAKIDNVMANARASMDGQTKATVDFENWLRLQSDSRINSILGPGRAAIWKTGKITVSDMTDQTNRPLTIEQLQAVVETGTAAPETLGQQFLPMVSTSVPLTAKTTAELNKKAAAEIQDIVQATEADEPAATAPDDSPATMQAMLASPAGQTLKAKWIKKIQADNPDMEPKDVLANATQAAIVEQAAKAKAAVLSKAKKKMVAGKELTPSELDTINGLSAEEANAFSQGVQDAQTVIAQKTWTPPARPEQARSVSPPVTPREKQIEELAVIFARGNFPTDKKLKTLNATLTPVEQARLKERVTEIKNPAIRALTQEQMIEAALADVIPARKAPVSASLQIDLDGRAAAQANHALSQIDKVMDDGGLTTIKIEALKKPKDYDSGEYNFDSRTFTAKNIAVNVARSDTALTTVHEIGHWLDNIALGTDGVGFGSEREADFAGLRKAFDESSAVKALRTRIDTAVTGKVKNHLKYMEEGREIFARAYTQYIVEKSGDPLLAMQLAADFSGETGQYSYWKNDDFRAIFDSFERIFKSKNLL